MRRGLLPAVLVAIGLYTFIFGDFTGDHRFVPEVSRLLGRQS